MFLVLCDYSLLQVNLACSSEALEGSVQAHDMLSEHDTLKHEEGEVTADKSAR